MRAGRRVKRRPALFAMPLKYVRTSHTDAARERLGHPWRPPPGRSFSPRHRLLLIYLGICTFVLMVLVYEIFAHFVGFDAGAVVQAVGEITARESLPQEEGAPALLRFEVEVLVGGERARRGSITVPESYADALAAGDRVGVLYRGFGDSIRIEQIGAVALPPLGE